MEYVISERLKDTFGVLVSGVDIGAIKIDKNSEGYLQLMAVTRDVAATEVEAETQDYVERLRIQRKEGQYAVHKRPTSAHSRWRNRPRLVLQVFKPLARWG